MVDEESSLQSKHISVRSLVSQMSENAVVLTDRAIHREREVQQK